MTELELQSLKKEFFEKKKTMEIFDSIGDKKSAYRAAHALYKMIYEENGNSKEHKIKYSLNEIKAIGWLDIRNKYKGLFEIDQRYQNDQDAFLDKFRISSHVENTATAHEVEQLFGTIAYLSCQKRLHACNHFPEIENNNDFPKDVMYLVPESKSRSVRYRFHESASESSIEVSENIYNDLISKVNEFNQTFNPETYTFFQEKLDAILLKQNNDQPDDSEEKFEEGLKEFVKTYTQKSEIPDNKKEQATLTAKKLQGFNKKESHTQLFDVPGDGHCLFWSSALGLLMPKLDDSVAFETMYQRLFGSEQQQYLESTKQQLIAYRCKNLNALQSNPLEKLICEIFRGRVVDNIESALDDSRKSAIAIGCQENLTWEEYAQQMRTTNAWGGQAEILAIERLANVKIFVENYDSYQSESQSEEVLRLKLVNNNHFQYYLKKEVYEKQTKRQAPQHIYIDAPKDNTQLDINKLEKHLSEFKELNPSSIQISAELKSKIENIQKSYESFSNWQAKEIKTWASNAKVRFKDRKPNAEEIAEIIAVIDRANFIATYQIEHKKEPKHIGHRLRDTQLLSLLLTLEAKPDQGRLLQIKTGQGKTTITAAMAVIKALQGEFVDIITSSPILAEGHTEEKQAFYELFNLTVAHNNHDSSYLFGPRECYKANIVYGSVENFQFDLLNHEYKDLETRDKREFSKTIALVDEVDSMLLDNGGHVAKLSAPMPGMESLQAFYIKIWRLLQDKEAMFLAELTKKEFSEEDIQTGLYRKILEEFFSNKKKDELVETVKTWINSNNPSLPNFLEAYAKNQAKTWVDNAFKARYELQEEVDYRLMENNEEQEVIVPVDFANTGVTQANTLWSDGLHQFLQLKHQVELTTESPTTAFISNVDYFLRYTRGKIFGMSGTLGGTQEQSLLAKVYHLDCLSVPTYEPSRLKKFPTKFANTQDDWIKRSINKAYQAATHHQAVLLLCETRADALKFEVLLQEKNLHGNLKIKTYIDEDDADVAEEQVESGTIIIATNLAGRGTDLKTTKEVDERGGLYVLETFFASNLRVQEQANGRTARQGKPGQVCLVLEKQRTLRTLDIHEQQWDDIKKHHQPMKELNTIREAREQSRLHNIEINELPTLRVQDALFKQYNALCRELKNTQKEKRKNSQNDETFHIKLQALEDSFGFWLMSSTTKETIKETKLNEDGTIPNDKIVTCFQAFKQGVVEAFNTSDLSDKLDKHVIQNPIYYTQMGNYWLSARNFDKAKQAFEKAQQKIGADSPFNIANAYHLASLSIEQNKVIEKKLLEAVGSLLPFLKSVLDGATQQHDNYKKITQDSLNKTSTNLDVLIQQKQTSLDTLFWHGITLIEGDLQEAQKEAVCRGETYLVIKKDNLYFLGFCNNEGKYEEWQISDTSRITSHDVSIIKNDAALRKILEEIITDKKGFNAQELMLLQPTELAKGFRTQLSMLELFNAQIKEQKEFCDKHKDEEWIIQNRSSVATRDSLLDLGFSKEAIDNMSENAINEFATLGLNQIHQFGEVQSIDDKVKNGAIGQIYGALGILAAGGVVAFFTAGQALYYAMSIAAVMISEALTDLVTELLLTREEKMSTEEYAIGKAVTYGTALLGAGLAQLFKTPMILQKAISGCQKLTSKLNRVKGVFKGITGRSAGLLKRAEGKLATRLNSLKTAAELEKDLARLTKQKNNFEKTAAKLRKNNQINKAEKVTNKVKKLEGNIETYQKALAKKQYRLTGTQVAKRISQETGMDVAMTAISMKVLEPAVTKLLEQFKLIIENAVSEKIKNDVELRTRLLVSSQNDIQQKASKILEDNLEKQISEACKNISVNLLTRARSIKLKLLATGLDFTIAISECTTLTENFCKTLKPQLSGSSENLPSEKNDAIDKKIQQLSQLVTNKIIQKLTNPMTRALSTHIVGPLISGRWFSRNPNQVADISFKSHSKTNHKNPLSIIDIKMLADRKNRVIKIKVLDENDNVIREEIIRPHGLRKILSSFKKRAEFNFIPGKENEAGHYIAENSKYQQAKGNNDCLLIAYRESLNKHVNPEIIAKERKKLFDYIDNHRETHMKSLDNLRKQKRDAMLGGAVSERNKNLQKGTISIDHNGEIKIPHDTDIKNILCLGSEGMRWKYIDQNMVAKEANRPPPPDGFNNQPRNEVEEVRHHVIGGETFEGMCRKCQNIKDEKTLNSIRLAFEKYINTQPVLKEKLAAVLSSQDKPDKKQDHVSRAIYQHLYWLPHNIVLGPKGEKRAHDPNHVTHHKNKKKPGYDLDEEILKVQDKEYIEYVEKINNAAKNNNPNDFFILLLSENHPRPASVIWEKNDEGKYSAKRQNDISQNSPLASHSFFSNARAMSSEYVSNVASSDNNLTS